MREAGINPFAEVQRRHVIGFESTWEELYLSELLDRRRSHSRIEERGPNRNVAAAHANIHQRGAALGHDVESDHVRIGFKAPRLHVAARRGTPSRIDDTIYLITDPLLHKLAGNLDTWPQAVEQGNGWVSFPVIEEIKGNPETDKARASVIGQPMIAPACEAR